MISPKLLPLFLSIFHKVSQGMTIAPTITEPARYTPPVQTTDLPDLHKRAGSWIEVCPTPGATENCDVIGIDQVLDVPGEGHYIPECDENGKCQWIGFDEPSFQAQTTSYSIVTSKEQAYVVPIPVGIPPVEPPPPPPPPPPEDLPELPDYTAPQETGQKPTKTQTEQLTSASACILKTTTAFSTTQVPVSFNDEWFNSATAEQSYPLTYQLYWDWPSTLALVGNETATPTSSALSCSTNTAGLLFDGSPEASPTAWCVCPGGRIFPTLSADPKAPCVYTSLPSSTLSIQQQATHSWPGGYVPTSCRTITTTFPTATEPGQASFAGPQTYCTCNDESMYPYTSSSCQTSGPVPKQTTTSNQPSPSPVTPYSFCMKDRAFNIYINDALREIQTFCSAMATNPPISADYSCAVPNANPPWHPKMYDGTCSDQADILFSVGLDTVTEACKGMQWTAKMFDQKNCERAMSDVIQACPQDPQYKGATQGGRESLDCVLYRIEPFPRLTAPGSPCSYVEAETCQCGWISKGAKCKSVGCDCLKP